VRSALADPVIQRILQDEPELLGQYLTTGSVAALATQITELITPVLQAAMASGQLPATDAAMAAGTIVRTVLALVVVPPPDRELEATVRFALKPMLR
jgi:hypothetical protein